MIKFCSFNRKYKPKTFHFPLSLSPHTHPTPINPVLLIYLLSMLREASSLSLSCSRLFMFARTHTRSLFLSINNICHLLSLVVVVTFDVDMLRQSHQLALSSIYTQYDYISNVGVFVCFIFHFSHPCFFQCSNKNHNHFGKIECILFPFSMFSFAQPLCVAVCV